MNGEFYPGWFDAWGRAHHKGDTAQYLADLKYMLDRRHSFSIYMAHGGTTFGLWSGADRPFSPDTSSYDYDAPISEAGWETEKFEKTRELFARYLQPGETLPPLPAKNPVIAVPPFRLTRFRYLADTQDKSFSDPQPRTMEAYGQSRGCLRYTAVLPAGPAGTLSAREVHDYGWVDVGGEEVGVLDRRSKHYGVSVPAREGDEPLSIIVEAVGRVNFGKEVADRKGLFAPVLFTAADGSGTTEVKNWTAVPVPLEETDIAKLAARPAVLPSKETPEPRKGFWRGQFDLKKTGDTFLDVRSWGKGVVWVNGHCLGRFWNIGPTQTMYLPGPWLKTGENRRDRA